MQASVAKTNALCESDNLRSHVPPTRKSREYAITGPAPKALATGIPLDLGFHHRLRQGFAFFCAQAAYRVAATAL